ncbi:variable large family protein (plasmid) [Borrelia coriaceae]|uniref:variable large family protein n=1 Tax=Borrelia coriaceae TaxID=144 RepID=UPI00047FFB67|nr:variable large family protein [Borrelia coriaceae]UPA17531.1 variable large family protein [Borrelia coriaceae]
MKINIKNIRVKSICATLFISLFLSCNSGVIEELEKRNIFLSSLANLGNDFLSVFTSFGNSMDDALGFTAVKSTDTRDKVGKHFEKIGEGLKSTKTKLEEFSKQIVATPNADTKGVEAINSAIKGANDIFDKLIGALIKLASVTKDNTPIAVDYNSKPTGADGDDVKITIEGVKEIIETAKGSGIKIEPGNDGGPVANSDGDKAPAALVGKNSNKAGAKAGLLLAGEVAKADAWSMISKIGKAKTDAGGELANDTTNEVVALATQATTHANSTGAKSTADLAAAVALKAMTKKGKFSVNSNDEEVGAVQAAAANAVNKVLGVLNEIIRKTVASNLEKIREVVKKIQYSENDGDAIESGTTQPTTK